jgi:sec-independent protein translocase protein TatA
MPFGAGHLPLVIILLIVAVIVLGPSKLPELGAGMGKAIREFKQHTGDLRGGVTGGEPAPAPIAVVQPPAGPDHGAASRDHANAA